MPKVKVLQETEDTIVLQLEGVDRSYANAVRRFCISEVPSMAIDDIVILENSSVLYDEILAHRLGMIPLRTDLERYVLPEKCDCASTSLRIQRLRGVFTATIAGAGSAGGWRGSKVILNPPLGTSTKMGS